MSKKKKMKMSLESMHMFSCACGFLTPQYAKLKAECPFCHTKLKLRPAKKCLFTEENRDALLETYMQYENKTLVRHDVIGGSPVKYDETSASYPKPIFAGMPENQKPRYVKPLVKNSFEDCAKEFMDFKSTVLENARMEYSSGYNFTTLQSPKRDRAAAYVKAMKQRRLVLFEYEPTRYERYEKVVKVEDPYKPSAKTASFDIEEIDNLILGIGEAGRPDEVAELTPSQIRAYEENRESIIATDPTACKNNAGRCSTTKACIFNPYVVEQLQGGPMAIKKLLNTSDDLRWTRFGELALFSRNCPFVEIEALMIVQGARYQLDKSSAKDCLMRVRFKAGVVTIWYGDKIGSSCYTMGISEMKIWAAEICYVMTPLIAKGDHRRYIEGMISADPMLPYKYLCKRPEVAVHGIDDKIDLSTVHVHNTSVDDDDDADYIVEDDSDEEEPADMNLEGNDELGDTYAFKCEDKCGLHCGYLLCDYEDYIFTWSLYDKKFKLVDMGATLGKVEVSKQIEAVSDMLFDKKDVNIVLHPVNTLWFIDRAHVDFMEIEHATCAAYRTSVGSYLRISRDRAGEYKWYLFDDNYKYLDHGFVNNYGKLENAVNHVFDLLGVRSDHLYKPESSGFREMCKKIIEANDGQY